MTNKQLHVFLCSGKEAQEPVRLLHRRLCADGIDCVLDEEMPVGGQNWKVEIRKKIKSSDIVIICLLKKIIIKEGYIHEEIQLALDTAKEKPEGTIYLIPARLEKCSVPSLLKEKQSVDLFAAKGYEKLVNALRIRAGELKRDFPENISTRSLLSSIERGESWEDDKDSSRNKNSIKSFSPMMFVNRQDEIDEITATASSGGQYFLIDAPAGYGKTWLIEQLDEKFKDKEKTKDKEKWLHAFVSVKKDETLAEITKKLAEKLGTKLSPDENLDWGHRISGGLKRRYQGSSIPAGVVLLIDLDGEPSIPLIKQLFGRFIPQVWENLSELEAFSRYSNPSLFRVIVSGRNIATEKRIKTFREQLPFINRILSPFTYDVVYKSARNYLPEIEKKRLDQLVAHLVFVTGGHPGCMSSVLELFKEQNIPIERFFADARGMVWGQIVRDATEKVWNGIQVHNNGLQEVIERLSVYHYVNNHVLRHIVSHCSVKGVRDAIDLRDILTASYLYSGDGRFLQDGIIRHLVLINLRYTNPNLYAEYCKDAYQICKEQLESPDVQLPERWIVEMLNQYLLQHAGNGIDQPAFRTKLSKEFNKEVASIMQVRRQTKQKLADWREEVDALLSEMDKDPQWEFRFSVNYFLRDGHYTEEPFQKLRAEIKRYSK